MAEQTISRRGFMGGCLGLAISGWTAGARAGAAADRYPDHAIRFVCPFAPGGSVDISSRQVARGLTEKLGQAVVVENRSGSSGIVGTQAVAHSEPDGYTMVMGSSSTFGVNPSFYPDMGYDAIKDFAPVSMVSIAPNVLVINPQVPARTVQEFVALLKRQPGKFSYASSGYGGAPHLAGELFKMEAKVDILHVPYRGTGQAVADLVSGHVQMSFGTALALLPLIHAGQVRPLAVTGTRRLVSLPQVPTMAEAGYPGVQVTAWNGVLVPAHTPVPVVDKLNRAIVDMLNDPAVKDQFEKLGAEPQSSTPQEFQRYIAEEITRWGKVIKAAGLHI